VRTTLNGVTTEYQRNLLNQYTSVGERTYSYDADGNMVEERGPDGIIRWAYDDRNRAVAVSAGAATWEFTYDGLEQRASTTQDGKTTWYVTDPTGYGNLVGIYDGQSNLMARFAHAGGLLSGKLLGRANSTSALMRWAALLT